ncbi:DUF2147 domain-containing protein [Pacificimonas flava]|uniref:DUF2147 domain-containing protein n=1 Tax=Pacificimonas flava TaxID=1234595 RepID=M2TP49_9SPHN|nr:DUF2147 domain-containing protein [Pacificimonas flava]EMD83526.1 hypothetical protein C725_1427 [Pacificimonas flava]MBB5278921.1 uncharacterized protein (DUF2147 family) [Pacificimonas flava]
MSARRTAAWALAAALTLLSLPTSAAQPVAGDWITEDGKAVVRIADCGASLCGRVVEFLVPPPSGPDQRDIHNPDTAKRHRKVLGLAILTGFEEDGDEWRGEIYDPKKGQTYRSLLERSAPDRLQVKGCVGPFCQTQIWRRAD